MKVKYITLSLLIIGLILVIYPNLSVSDYGMKVLGILGFVQLVYSIYSWKKITGTMLAPYIVFLVSAYTFTFGQSLLFVFDKVSPERDLMNLFNSSEIMPAQYLTLVFLGFFHIGGLFSCNYNNKYVVLNKPYSLYEKDCINNQKNGIRKVGKLFLLISTFPYIIERISIFFIVLTTGYGGLYEQEIKIGIFNIINILSQYFLPGILCFLLIEESKKKRNFYILLLIFEIVFWMYVGGRSTGVIVTSIVIMYYHFYIKKIRFKQAAILAVSGFFFVSLLGIIAETRSDVNATIKESLIQNMGQGEAFYSAISEMGGSMYPMITTMELVPTHYEYKYGSSYLFSLSSIIPNLGFWDLHPAMKYGNLNDWLQNAMNLNYGPGYSIVAEAYINFGNYGWLIMMIIGYCFGKIFNVNIRNQKNPLLLVLSFIFCFLIIKTVRNSFLSTVRSIFYYIIPIYLIVKYYYKGRLVK